MAKNKKYPIFILIVLISLLCYVAAYGLYGFIGDMEVNIKGAPQIRLGIDIRGGVEATFVPVGIDRKPTIKELEAIKKKMEIRMDSKGILDREIPIDKLNGRVLVRFPWKSEDTSLDPQAAITELGATAKLRFVEAEYTQTSSGYEITNELSTIFEGNSVVSAKALPSNDSENPSTYMVMLTINDSASTAFAEATGRLIGKPIFIMLDDVVESSPTVRSKIEGTEVYITDISTAKEAKYLADVINAGALPFALESTDNNIISPILGDRALGVMINAGLVAFIIISMLLIFIYRLPGIVAIFTLVMQISIQILSISLFNFTLTLPGIAGIILSIGIGVDANVVIFERIKEELRAGKTLDGAVQLGYKKAASAIIDGNVTVVIVAILLMFFGSGTMYSFGYTLFIGVVCNLLCGVITSRSMIRSTLSYNFFRNPTLFLKKKRRL